MPKAGDNHLEGTNIWVGDNHLERDDHLKY